MGQPIKDEKGNVLGYFLSAAEYTRLMYDLAKAEAERQAAVDAAAGPPRRWDGTNGMTTADVKALFRRLDEERGAGR